MATLRDIRRRISGVKSTQKITKAMKMVAAAKLRRAQDAIISLRPYARKMKQLLEHLAGVVDVTAFPLFQARPVQRVMVVVVTSDRGLSGAFNVNVIKAAVAHIDKNYASIKAAGGVQVICIGKKGFEAMKRRQYNIVDKHLGIFSTLTFAMTASIVDGLVSGFLDGKYDRVDVVYNEFKSIVQQHVAIEQLLPVATPPAADRTITPVDYIYEPGGDAIISALVPKHLNFQLWRMLLESNAAAQGAQMTAMDNATRNASDLIRNLQLVYNNARQAAITKELLEIVSGAEALRQAS
jgi:F-type H+-transporting ATPase subunit gamma